MTARTLLIGCTLLLTQGCSSSREPTEDAEPIEDVEASPEQSPQAGQAAPNASESTTEDAGAGAQGEDTAEPPETDGASDEHSISLDGCGLDTGFPGDEYCIDPPPADQGFQLHIGPSDYANPDPIYVLQPGDEDTSDYPATSTNEEDIYFYYRQYRMRPGAHHMIASRADGGGIAGGRRIATANISEDSPPGGIIAPENQGVGIPLPAKTQISVSLHSINVTDEPILREIWVNFWYRDPELVTETAEQLFQIGDASFSIAPGDDTILGPYSCDINEPGRMLWFYGHRHANNVRFSAWRVRGEQRDLFYEGFDWEDVMVLQYSTLVENPEPDRERRVEGGWSGPLDLEPGDRLEWECHVVNELDTPLRFTNQTYLGEMCIMDGEIVGTNCSSGAGFAF